MLSINFTLLLLDLFLKPRSTLLEGLRFELFLKLVYLLSERFYLLTDLISSLPQRIRHLFVPVRGKELFQDFLSAPAVVLEEFLKLALGQKNDLGKLIAAQVEELADASTHCRGGFQVVLRHVIPALELVEGCRFVQPNLAGAFFSTSTT